MDTQKATTCGCINKIEKKITRLQRKVAVLKHWDGTQETVTVRLAGILSCHGSDFDLVDAWVKVANLENKIVELQTAVDTFERNGIVWSQHCSAATMDTREAAADEVVHVEGEDTTEGQDNDRGQHANGQGNHSGQDTKEDQGNEGQDNDRQDTNKGQENNAGQDHNAGQDIKDLVLAGGGALGHRDTKKEKGCCQVILVILVILLVVAVSMALALATLGKWLSVVADHMDEVAEAMCQGLDGHDLDL
ncbi:hypothetical protein QBC39DRAFT_68808 [Podospora conica]|nr:hypothetical protein QBC39DRAFT_68808 [Schizothecium conicum]